MVFIIVFAVPKQKHLFWISLLTRRVILLIFQKILNYANLGCTYRKRSKYTDGILFRIALIIY